MRYLLFLLVATLSSLSFSQDFNQLDEDGKRHGAWQKYFDNTKQIRYKGQFDHGKEIGVFKYYKLIRAKSMLAATKEFNKDNSLAKTKFYSSDGKLISEGTMNGKIYIGKWIYYHRGGKSIMTIEHYNDDGKLDGKKQVFYKNEQLAEDVTYKNGLLDSEAKYYSEQGKLIKHYVYDKGKLNGYSKHFNAKGQLLVEGAYKNDKKHGVWNYYKDGKLEKTIDYTARSKNPYKLKTKQ